MGYFSLDGLDFGAGVVAVADTYVLRDTLEDYIIELDLAPSPRYDSDDPPDLGEPLPGNDAPWEYICIDHHAFFAKSGPQRGEFLLHVKYAQVKVPYESGITGLYEVYRQARTGRRGRHMGTRVFLATDAEAEGLVAQHLPEFTPFATSGNWQTALLREADIQHRWRVGIARITCAYDSYAEGGQFERVGKGYLEIDASAGWFWNNRPQAAFDGHRLGEEFTEDGVVYRWVTLTGANAWPYVQTQLRIRVLLTTDMLKALAPLEGLVNSNACPNILSNARARTLWFNNLQSRQRTDGSDLHDTLIFLRFEPLGWDTVNQAVKQEKVSRNVKRRDTDGDDIDDEGQPAEGWETVSGVEPVKLLGWVEADMSYIDRFLR